ncbi:hypothetical protein ABGB16_11565 [Micromonospora sp. B11E3]|uniref:hypothetical protein n=1 Tax=Micromonospora sp. B11E3 TaxID=3153562 RepID=UPI00325E8CE5
MFRGSRVWLGANRDDVDVSASRLRRSGGEQLIDALVPPKAVKPAVEAPAPLPVLPQLSLPAEVDADGLVLGMARLERSGRLSARELLGVLGWWPGSRVDIGVVAGVLVAASASTGRHVVHGRGGLCLPAAVRQMCGLLSGVPVLLAASPSQQVLVVHPVHTVARLLAEHHTRLAAGDGHG